MFSNQIYCADINHRDIDYFVLKNEHPKGRALKDFFTNPKGKEQFDLNSSLVLLPHSMVPCGEDVDSKMHLKAQKLSKLPGQKVSMEAFVDGKMVAKISKKDFKRLLAIFGFEFVNMDKTPCDVEPTVQDLMKFIGQIRNFTLHGNGFENFEGLQI